MSNLFIYKELTKDDYHYLDFIFQFTNYKYSTNQENFKKYIDNLKNNNLGKIILLIEKNTSKIIGAGTILILHKIIQLDKKNRKLESEIFLYLNINKYKA